MGDKHKTGTTGRQYSNGANKGVAIADNMGTSSDEPDSRTEKGL